MELDFLMFMMPDVVSMSRFERFAAPALPYSDFVPVSKIKNWEQN